MLYRISIALSLAAAACGANDTGIDPMTCSTESTLTYENFGKDMIDTHCNGCHDTRSPRLTTIAGIRAAADDILNEAVYTDAMPEKSGMPLAQREMLGEWLSCGAP